MKLDQMEKLERLLKDPQQIGKDYIVVRVIAVHVKKRLFGLHDIKEVGRILSASLVTGLASWRSLIVLISCPKNMESNTLLTKDFPKGDDKPMSDDHCSHKPDPVLKQTGIAKIVNLGYYSRANGKSYYRVQCECGQVQEIYAWKGVKKCSRCGLILSVKYSPEGRLIVSELPEVKPEPRTLTVAVCNSCEKRIHYVHGVGWCHCEGKEFDHIALPVPNSLKRIVEKE